MTKEKIQQKLINNELKGFITAVDRSVSYAQKTHIYSGYFYDVGEPMCRYTPDSFLRNNFTGSFCKICLKKVYESNKL